MNEKQLYGKLQDLANKHAGLIYRNFRHNVKGRGTKRYITSGLAPIGQDSYIVTDWELQDTVKALGSGDANTMALRIHWYLVNYPQFFDGSTVWA